MVSIAAALDRLVVARSRKAIDGGLIVVDKPLSDEYLQALHFYDGSRLTLSSPFAVQGFDALLNSLSQRCISERVGDQASRQCKRETSLGKLPCWCRYRPTQALRLYGIQRSF